MTTNAVLQILFAVALVALLAPPLGAYLARVYDGRACGLDRLLGPLERAWYRLAGIESGEEMSWKRYAWSFLVFSVAGLVLLLGIQLAQGGLPLNPAGLPAVPFHLALNTAISFVTNTNWQSYGGETTMSHFTQMVGLAVQNFLSAAAGMAVLAAVVRGFSRSTAATLGNFWVDLTRGALYVLLPLSLLCALFLAQQGVPQTFEGSREVQLLEPQPGADGGVRTAQSIALGPVASQVAIKQLGTNGGGFYNVNSSHPLENPTPLSNLAQCLAILLIPAALCFAFGRMVRDPRQGRALFAAMGLVLVLALAACFAAEQSGNRWLGGLGLDDTASATQPGGNMEGKEVRFGIANSAIWATFTTAASNGSVNAMHDSFTPLGGLVPLLLMQLGEIIFGGVGCGLYGMLALAIVAMFLCGMMVGRTPEYLGKKLEPFEIKMAALSVLGPSTALLIGTAVALLVPAGRAGILNPGAHGFSEVLYAFTSAAQNNGSAFAGYGANVPFVNYALGLAMVIGRFVPAITLLAAAGSLAAKKRVPAGPGTMPTHGPLFVAILIGVILLSAALTFFPALALGPLAEHLSP